MTDIVLARIGAARTALIEAQTASQVKAVMDAAEAAALFARRQEMSEDTIRYAVELKLDAERKLGEILRDTPKNEGRAGMGRPSLGGAEVVPPKNTQPTLADLGITKKTSAQAQKLAALPAETFEAVKSGGITLADAWREQARTVLAEKLESIQTRTAKELAGEYDVIVIDPPWPMQKIERDKFPDQVGLDYPVMAEDELAALTLPAATDCHVWLWTTHKYLPMALRLLEAWKAAYVCTFVWHKPGGFQPFGLPQYNCEFALYARKGTPKFLDTKAFPVCFDAPRGAHSEKPEQFYEVIRRVTAGRRLDMFSRRMLDGFDSWGKEAPDVTAAE